MSRFVQLATVALCAVACSLPGLAAAQGTKGGTSSTNPAPCPSAEELSAVLGQASSALESGQPAGAISTLAPVAAHNCAPQAALLLAAAYEATGNTDQATATLLAAHNALPSDASIASSLARMYFQAHQPREAAGALAQYTPTPGAPLQELELCTVILLGDHQLQRAAETSRLAWTSYPSLQTLLLHANALQLEGRYKDVIALLDAQRATFGQSAPFLITVAESESDAKLFDRARSDLQAAVQLDPSRPQAHYLLGNLLAQTGDTDGAIAQYRIAIDQQPAQPRSYYQLALALRTKEDEPGEQAALKGALAADPNYAAAHCELGRILLNDGHPAQAVTELEASLHDNAQTEQAYYLLSKAWERLGDHAKSDAMAKRLAAVRAANHNNKPASDGSTANQSAAVPPSR